MHFQYPRSGHSKRGDTLGEVVNCNASGKNELVLFGSNREHTRCFCSLEKETKNIMTHFQKTKQMEQNLLCEAKLISIIYEWSRSYCVGFYSDIQ